MTFNRRRRRCSASRAIGDGVAVQVQRDVIGIDAEAGSGARHIIRQIIAAGRRKVLARG